MECIPEEWIKRQVDTLTKIAKELGDSSMGRAALVRAEYYMDLVKAYRNRENK